MYIVKNNISSFKISVYLVSNMNNVKDINMDMVLIQINNTLQQNKDPIMLVTNIMRKYQLLNNHSRIFSQEL